MQLNEDQRQRLADILQRVQTARRELDSLIGDNYLSPRVSVVAVHFSSLAAAVEKLRWAETQWRQLSDELESQKAGG